MKRREILMGSAAWAAMLGVSPSAAWAMGDEDRLRLAMLRPARGATSPREGATRRLLQELEKRTSVHVDPGVEVVDIGPEMFEAPFLILSGERGFDPWSVEQVDMLRTYLQAGGFLLVDASSGVSEGPFMSSVLRELGRIFPDEALAPVAKGHVLYKSFYLLDRAYGRVSAAEHMDAIVQGDRLPVVVSYNDLLGAWARDSFGNWEYDVVPHGDFQRERAFRLGINLVMYALCVNYKEDQVHIPFILKRRRWKVE
jgi:hypothetical protein